MFKQFQTYTILIAFTLWWAIFKSYGLWGSNSGAAEREGIFPGGFPNWKGEPLDPYLLYYKALGILKKMIDVCKNGSVYHNVL